MKLLKRSDIVIFFECKLSNPNGDPAAGGYPRVRDGLGRVTAESLRCHIREYIREAYGEADGMRLYTGNARPLGEAALASLKKSKAALSSAATAYVKKTQEEEADPKAVEDAGRKVKSAWERHQKALAAEYIDLRLFGGNVSKWEKLGSQPLPFRLGNFHGAVRVFPGETVAPVRVMEEGFTRSVRAKAADKPPWSGNMSRRGLVEHGLYRFHICINQTDAARAGATEEDVDIFIKALLNFPSFSRAAVRSAFYPVFAVIVEHENAKTGNCGIRDIERAVTAAAKTPAPASLDDYDLDFDPDMLPAGAAGRVLFDARPGGNR